MKSFAIYSPISKMAANALRGSAGLACCCLALAFCACSDELKYEPAEPVAADNWGVSFSGDNETEFVREPADEPSVEIVLTRENTKGSLTVPLETTQMVGQMTVPASATFNDGEDKAVVRIAYAGFPEVLPSVVISIPEMYTNPYKEKNGFSRQRVAITKTELIVDGIRWYDGSDGTTETMFSNCVSQVKWFVGQNKFIMTNFFGSGVDIVFKIDIDNDGTFDKNDLKKCGGGFVPLTNNLVEDEYGWSLCFDKNPGEGSVSATWTPEGQDVSINDYMYFYNYYNNFSYCSIYFHEASYGCGYAFFSSTVIDDGDNASYISYFDLLDEYK